MLLGTALDELERRDKETALITSVPVAAWESLPSSNASKFWNVATA